MLTRNASLRGAAIVGGSGAVGLAAADEATCVALPPRHAARLFEAQEQGASDDPLRETAAEALKETYFQDSGRRSGSLEEVHFTDIEHLEFDL